MDLKFTRKATDAIMTAEVASNKFREEKLSVESLLYGLTLTNDSLAQVVLDKYYINSTVMCEYLIRNKGQMQPNELEYESVKSEEYVVVMNRAEELAKIAGVEEISTDIILLSIIDNIESFMNIQSLFLAQLVDVTELANY